MFAKSTLATKGKPNVIAAKTGKVGSLRNLEWPSNSQMLFIFNLATCDNYKFRSINYSNK